MGYSTATVMADPDLMPTTIVKRPRDARLDWSLLAEYRAEVPDAILRVPLRWSTLYDAFASEVAPTARVLDVGANNREMDRQLRARGFRGTYRSMDVSSGTAHDYVDLADVQETFDVVTLKEVAEHLTIAELRAAVDHARRVLVPGGRLVLSTPNPHCVVSWQAWDMTHVQHYPYQDLHALLRLAGFEVRITRLAEPIFGLGLRLPLRLLQHAYRLVHVHCFRPTDFAGTLFAVATRIA